MCCNYPVLVILCLIGSRVLPPVDMLIDELGLSFTYLVRDRMVMPMHVTRVNRLMSRSMILTLREVLTKRHCVLKARLEL